MSSQLVSQKHQKEIEITSLREYLKKKKEEEKKTG
jgi:hypothetical protein